MSDKKLGRTTSQQPTQDKKTNTQRRLLLGGAIGASAVAWQTPVVKSIVLPAHAQMSAVAEYFAAAAAVSPITSASQPLKSPLDLLVAPAVAQEATVSEYTVGISSMGGDSFSVQLFERQLQGESNVGEFLFAGSLTLGASGTLAITENPCEAEVSNITATLAGVTADSATLNLTSKGEQLLVPAGNGTVPMPMCVDTGLPESFFVEDFPIGGGREVASKGLLDLLIPEAHAGGSRPIADGFRMLATKLSEEEYAVSHLNRGRNVMRQGNLMVDGTEGTLNFVSDACPESDSGNSNIPATIVSVDESEMVIELQLGERGPVMVTLPVGTGMLMAECSVVVENLTTNRFRVIPGSDHFGDKLLDMIVPPAQAGGIIPGANVVINATNRFDGSFDLEVGVVSEGGIEEVGIDLVFLADGRLTGTVSSGGGAMMLNNIEGCEYNISASAVVIEPNRLSVSLSGDVQSDFTLSEGMTMIDVISEQCGGFNT